VENLVTSITLAKVNLLSPAILYNIDVRKHNIVILDLDQHNTIMGFWGKHWMCQPWLKSTLLSTTNSLVYRFCSESAILAAKLHMAPAASSAAKKCGINILAER